MVFAWSDESRLLKMQEEAKSVAGDQIEILGERLVCEPEMEYTVPYCEYMYMYGVLCWVM